MLEPEKNGNSLLLVDPPGWLRHIMALSFSSVTDSDRIAKTRRKEERKRRSRGLPHRVEYFHQLDDPYSHLTAQLLTCLEQRYAIELITHLIPANGGRNQPEADQLAKLARRDAALIAPYFNLSFPEHAGSTPDASLTQHAGRILAVDASAKRVCEISSALWQGDDAALASFEEKATGPGDFNAALRSGRTRQTVLGHYSGATFFYGGEWYWGVDRLFHLEARLQALGATKTSVSGFLAPRPEADVTDIDASGLTLDFYPSLNSPYTSIIFDRVMALKSACNIRFRHKPVLPMIMRGVPITRAKGRYIMFDTKREADWADVPFGRLLTPIGTPTRKAYALLPWVFSIGKDEALMSALLRHAFTIGVGLHTQKGFRKAVEAAGLDWSEAKQYLSDDRWKPLVEEFQRELNDELGLWGVPSFRLSGPDGEADLIVWGQDRLWLIAHEIRRRTQTSQI